MKCTKIVCDKCGKPIGEGCYDVTACEIKLTNPVFDFTMDLCPKCFNDARETLFNWLDTVEKIDVDALTKEATDSLLSFCQKTVEDYEKKQGGSSCN